MVKSHSLGITSSNLSQDRPEVEKTLALLCGSEAVANLRNALNDNQLHLVGGLVRDAFFGITNTDIDLATSFAPGEVVRICQSVGIRVIETGVEHGTVLAVIDGIHIEVTTFREPRSRKVHLSARDIETDLSGRDFTINAIGFNVRTSTLVDPHKGIEDLQSGILRSVGSADDRFIEDPLRILRLLRFGPAQGRSVHSATKESAKRHIALLAEVSVERIKSELDKILISPCAGDAVRMLNELGGLAFTLPELIPAVGFEQNSFHIHDVFEHTLSVLDRAPREEILRWTAIFHDTGKPHTLSVDDDGHRHFYLHEVVSERFAKSRMNALKFSNDDAQSIALLVRQHMRPLDCGAPGVRRIMRDLGSELERWRLFKRADCSPTQSEEEFQAAANQFDSIRKSEASRLAGPSYGKLALTGDDLIAMGLQPGPEFGRLFKELIELVLDDPDTNTKAALLAAAKAKLRL